MRWSEAVTLEFVKLYGKHECLWNPEHSGYRTKHEKTKAYASLSSEFKAATSISLPIPEVKIKIKNLRSTYMQEVIKIMQRSTPDSMYESRLVWFNEMDRCLKRVPVNRHSPTDDTLETSEIDLSCPVWLDLDNQPSESNTDPLTRHEEDNCSSHEESSNVKVEWPSSPLPKKNKKRKYKLRNTAYVEETSSSSGSREDEFDIYGKYIATQLRSMELQKALKVQLKIQSLISRARISDTDSFE